MLLDFYATKLRMTQVWTTDGKRLPVTVVKAEDMKVITTSVVKIAHPTRLRATQNSQLIEVGVGVKKLKAMKKPLRAKLSQNGFSVGVANIKAIHVPTDQEIKPGSSISFADILQVGDVVQVQGTTQGKGFAGAMKRHGFSGGPKTHGQSDRSRAVGSIGMGTTPGRVFKGKRMPGRMGGTTQTVLGLTVIHVDLHTNEVWLSGPIPGSIQSCVRIRKTGKTKSIVLDKTASGIVEQVATPIASDAEAQEPAVQQEPTSVRPEAMEA